MISGFAGEAAMKYLTKTTEALSEAASANTLGTSRGTSPVTVNDAKRSRFETGVGNSSNIVVDRITYSEAMRMLDSADERIGELFYNISNELEDMCKMSYIVPQTGPKFLHICGSVKNSMGKFRSLTGDLAMNTERFVRDITDIG